MIVERRRKRENLKNCAEPFDSNSNYQKVKNMKNLGTTNKNGINKHKIEEDFNKRQYNSRNLYNYITYDFYKVLNK